MRKIISAILTTLALTLGGVVGAVTTASPANADPCFFNHAEWFNWYNGARWSDSLDHVENAYANCVGAWTSDNSGPIDMGSWSGHKLQQRVWPRADGGQSTIMFAHYGTTPFWRAHSSATTGNLNVGGSDWVKVCEWGRPSDAPPCQPA